MNFDEYFTRSVQKNEPQQANLKINQEGATNLPGSECQPPRKPSLGAPYKYAMRMHLNPTPDVDIKVSLEDLIPVHLGQIVTSVSDHSDTAAFMMGRRHIVMSGVDINTSFEGRLEAAENTQKPDPSHVLEPDYLPESRSHSRLSCEDHFLDGSEGLSPRNDVSPFSRKNGRDDDVDSREIRGIGHSKSISPKHKDQQANKYPYKPRMKLESFDNLSCKEQFLENLMLEEISSYSQLATFFGTQVKKGKAMSVLQINDFKLEGSRPIEKNEAQQITHENGSKRKASYRPVELKSCTQVPNLLTDSTGLDATNTD